MDNLTERNNPYRPSTLAKAYKQALARDLREAEYYSDIIAIVRGGGSGLEVFDDVELANAVLDASVPVIAAIGHDKDNPLVKEIADKALSTPTAFGNYLREMALVLEEDRTDREGISDNIQGQSIWGYVLGILFLVGMLLLLFWRN